MVTTPSGMGGNSPPIDLSVALDPEVLRRELEDQFRHKAERRDALLAGVARFRGANPDGITSEEVQAKAGDFVRQLKQESKQLDGLRTDVKRPVLDASKVIDGFFKNLMDALQLAAADIEKAMTAYARAEADRRRREAEAAARAAAEKAAREAEEAARRADADRLARAVDQEQVAIDDLAAAQTAKAADFSRTHGDLGSVSSLVTRWEFEVIDLRQVPPHYLALNEYAVRQAIRDGVRDVPGLRIFESQRVVVR